MKTLHSDKFFYLALDTQYKLLYFHFTEHSIKMSREEYITELQVYLQFLHKYQPKGALGNMMDFKYVIDPNTQEWMNKHIFSVYAQIGFTKMALLPSEDFVPNLSIKQTMEGDTTKAFNTKYFTDKEKARNWLLSTITGLVAE